MSDKVTLIRKEIERIKKYYEKLQEVKPVYEIAINMADELLSFIDSLKEEELAQSSLSLLTDEKPSNCFDSHIQEGDKITVNEDGSRFNRSQLERVIASQEEPVSEELEEAAREAATWHSRNGGERFFPNDYQKFIAGANWMKQQMMKDAMHVDSETEWEDVYKFINRCEKVLIIKE